MVNCSGALGGPSSLPSQQVTRTGVFPPRPAATNGAMTSATFTRASFALRSTTRTTSGDISSDSSDLRFGRVPTRPNLRW